MRRRDCLLVPWREEDAVSEATCTFSYFRRWLAEKWKPRLDFPLSLNAFQAPRFSALYQLSPPPDVGDDGSKRAPSLQGKPVECDLRREVYKRFPYHTCTVSTSRAQYPWTKSIASAWRRTETDVVPEQCGRRNACHSRFTWRLACGRCHALSNASAAYAQI